MSRVAYVNGRYVPHRAARVHVEDRGYQFADAVYEVIAVADGRFLDEDPHLDRLDRSLKELRIGWPIARAALKQVLRETVRRNRVRNGLVYFQVSRGVARRDYGFPKDARPSLVVTARSAAPPSPDPGPGVAVITVPDIRWKRVDIKTTGLLGGALGKQKAREQGAYEAWQVDDDGRVTEGTSSNAWIVTAKDELVTRPIGHEILAGITRQTVKKVAADLQLAVVERPFTVAEAQAAREAFMTSATSYVTPIVSIDGKTVGDGKPGDIARRLRAEYLRAVAAATPFV
ncbi:MAG: D-amino-acid transaminase [Alphaproteobacteria bacterium]|nr:D-amino-acid transaminase [Alphaproteobacteria bacterium]